MEVRSAGLEAREGKPAQPGALRVAPTFGVDLADHAAHRMEREDVEWADLVLGMEGWHLTEVIRRWPEGVGKVHLLGDFLDAGPFRIEDPYGEEDAVFERVFARISESVEALSRVLDETEKRA